MNGRRQGRNDAGFTLLELMVASGVFAISLVALLGGVVQLTSHNEMTQRRALANTFNRNTLETLRGMDAAEILAWEIPLDDPELGTVTIPGFGQAMPRVFALIPDGQGGVTPFEIGVDDPATVPNPPNPLEVQMRLVRFDPHTMRNPDTGDPQLPETHESFTASTKVSF